MPDIATLAQIVLAVLLISVPGLLFAALVRGADPWSFADLFRAPDHNAWPRGVQEEEPFRWGSGRSVQPDVAPDRPAAPASGRTAPRQLRPAGSAAGHDPIGEVA